MVNASENLKGKIMKTKYAALVIGLTLVMLTASVVASAPRNELTMRFIKVLNMNTKSSDLSSLTGGTQITPLFIRSTQKGDIDLTMLIAYDDRITTIAKQIMNTTITPLIFSVSTMPFMDINFQPELLTFEQNGKKWSPVANSENGALFPLDENIPFGGKLTETQPHQGVIMLPGWFDMNNPIEINYKSFRKVCLLK